MVSWMGLIVVVLTLLFIIMLGRLIALLVRNLTGRNRGLIMSGLTTLAKLRFIVAVKLY